MERRRSQSSVARDCIVTALIELMKQQPYESISITDVCDRAGVSRMTYYRNYSSKEEVLETYIKEMGTEIARAVDAAHNQDRQLYFRLLFERLGSYSDVGLIAHKANLGGMVLRGVTGYMMSTFSELTSTEEGALRAVCLAGAFYNLFITWVRGGKQESADYLARLMCSVMAGICQP